MKQSLDIAASDKELFEYAVLVAEFLQHAISNHNLANHQIHCVNRRVELSGCADNTLNEKYNFPPVVFLVTIPA